MTSLPAWPAYAIDPFPLNDNFGHTFSDKLAREPFEQGAARQRRINRSAFAGIPMTWAMTPVQYEIFRTWLEFLDKAGADWFTMDVFRDDDYENTQVRFVKGSISPKRQGGEWIVNANIELNDLSTLSSAALDAEIGAADASILPPWPEAVLLPEPLNDQFAHQLADPINRADFSSGDIEQTRPFTAAATLFDISWPFTNAQYKTFRAFVKWRLADGEKWFTIPFFHGSDYDDRTVRFVKKTLGSSRNGYDWIVKAQIEMRDFAPLSEADATILALGGGDETVYLAGLLYPIVHTDYPGATP
ncbi:MAG: hypothetical protein WCA78_00725 [Rhizomicrobium sp.]